MKTIASVIAGVFLCGVASFSFADDDKDERGHGRYSNERRADKFERRADRFERRVHRGGEYKEEYWDGNCKVKREWKRNGKYKEERECEGLRPRASSFDPYPYPNAMGPQVPRVILELPRR